MSKQKRLKGDTNRLGMDMLEPRVLLSADALALAGLPGLDGGDSDAPWDRGLPDPNDLPTGVDASADGPDEDEPPTQPLQSASARATSIQLLFVDTRVPDYSTLIDQISAAYPDADLTIHLIDGERDGLDQIGNALAGLSGVDAVHIISHGSANQLQLGSTSLSSVNVHEYVAVLGAWSDSLTAEADLLLYGCDLAADAQGKALVETIGALTGADVAASTNTTGDADRGGDWKLEFTAGAVEAPQLSLQAGATDWEHTLALLAYESFDYPDGTSISSLNGGTGWATAWADVGNNHTITAAGLESSDGMLVTEAGALQISLSGASIQITRDIATAIGAEGTSIWVSFLVTPDITGPSDWAGVAFGDPGGTQVWVGQGADGFGLNDSGGITPITVPGITATSGQTYLLAAEINFTSGNDSVTLYVDPTPGETSPDSTFFATKSNRDLGDFSEFVLWSGSSTNQPLIDELRIGDTFADVAPSTEYLDRFNSIAFDGDDGSLTWSAYWQEFGESDGANSGSLSVFDGFGNSDFELRLQEDGFGVWREADLSGATTATLSFDYARTGLDGVADAVSVYVQDNGGTGGNVIPGAPGTWDQIARIDGTNNDTNYRSASYDISAYIASDTRILFAVEGLADGGDSFYLDDVRIDLVTTPNATPILGNNTLTLNEGETVTLTVAMLSATDADNADSGLIFNVSAVSGGQFELTSNLGVGIASFTQQQISDGFVIFVDDGDEAAPSFNVSVSDGTAATAPVTGGVSFTPSNNMPTTTGISDVTVDEDAPNTVIDLHAAFDDTEDADTALTYTVESNSNGALFDSVAIASGNLTLDYTANQHGSANITVRATDSGGLWEETTFSVTVNSIEDLPVAGNDSYTTAEDTAIVTTLGVDDLLQNDSDDDGDTLTVNTTPVSNVSNGTLVLNANGTFTYTPNANYTGNDGFTYEVDDGKGNTAQAMVSITVTGINSPPTGGVSISDMTPSEGDLLTAANTIADADGISGPILYQWQRDGLDIAGAQGATYAVTTDDIGSVILVVASYTDADGNPEILVSNNTRPVANSNDPPSGTLAIDNASPSEGDLLTVSGSIDDADGLSGPIDYQWQRDGSDIGGANGTSYTATEADIGAVLSVVATYTDDQGSAERVNSLPTDPVANVNQAPSGSVTIDNQAPLEGDALTVSHTLTDDDGLSGPVSYQWQRNGVDIADASGEVYVVTLADVGQTITVVALYTDDQGSAERVGSNTATPSAVAPPAVTASSTASGDESASLATKTPETDTAPVTPHLLAAPEVTDSSYGLGSGTPTPDAADQEPEDNASSSTEDETVVSSGVFTPDDSIGAETSAPQLPQSLLSDNDNDNISKGSSVDNAQSLLKKLIAIKALPAQPVQPTESFEPSALAAEIRAVLTSSGFNNGLDEMRQEVADTTLMQRAMIGSTAAVTTSLSVGYVAWLIRGGVLLSTMLSSLPAWQIVDPLPVLARTGGDEEDEDDEEESLEDIIQKQSTEADADPVARQRADESVDRSETTAFT